MNKFCCFIIFSVGITVGAAVSCQYYRKKYEKITQDEIDSVKKIFSKKKIDLEEINDETRKVDIDLIKNVKKTVCSNIEKSNIESYTAELHEHNHITSEVHGNGEISKQSPYVISPKEFGVLDDYATISLSYYADQVLADDEDQLIENIDEIVGIASLDYFGEYEDDSVFVRNETLKCDYEILLDQRKYSEVMKIKPGGMFNGSK